MNKILPTLQEFKKEAQANKNKFSSLGHSQNSLAKYYGYENYRAIRNALFNEDNISLYNNISDLVIDLLNHKYEANCLSTNFNANLSCFTITLDKPEDKLKFINSMIRNNFPEIKRVIYINNNSEDTSTFELYFTELENEIYYENVSFIEDFDFRKYNTDKELSNLKHITFDFTKIEDKDYHSKVRSFQQILIFFRYFGLSFGFLNQSYKDFVNNEDKEKDSFFKFKNCNKIKGMSVSFYPRNKDELNILLKALLTKDNFIFKTIESKVSYMNNEDKTIIYNRLSHFYNENLLSNFEHMFISKILRIINIDTSEFKTWKLIEYHNRRKQYKTPYKELLKDPEVKEIEVFGQLLPKDKRITERSSGYTYYFQTFEGLKKYSAFGYKICKEDT